MLPLGLVVALAAERAGGDRGGPKLPGGACFAIAGSVHGRMP